MKNIIFIILIGWAGLAQSQYNQLNQQVSAIFNANGVIGNELTYYQHGGIDNNIATLLTEEPVSYGATKFIFENNFTTAHFTYELFINQISYILEIDNNSIYDNTNQGHTLLSSGLSTNDEIIIGYTDAHVVFMLNDDMLAYYDTGISEEQLEAKVTMLNNVSLVGDFLLTELFYMPKIKVNFVEDTYYVSEGQSVDVEFELSVLNSNSAPIDFDVDFTSTESPHFQNNTGPYNVQVPVNSLGPVSLNIPSEPANGVEDSNILYTIEITGVNSPFVEIGESNTAEIIVVDDFIKDSNVLNPGDIMFVAYDNDIGSDDDKIALTNLVPLKPNTSFQIVRASVDNQNKWYDNDDITSGKIVSQQITYTGSADLEVNSILCMEPPGTGIGEDLLIGQIVVDGTVNPDFIIENIGSDPNPSLNISLTDPTTLFIVQGFWTYHSTYSNLLGTIISGISIGADWVTSGSITNGTSSIPEEVECFEIQADNTTGSVWAYFQCQTPYNDITIMDLRKEIADFSNWTGGTGDNQENFGVDVCTSTCDIVETYEPLVVTAVPADITVECSEVAPPSGTFLNWLDNGGNLTVTGGCYPVTFTNDFVSADPNQCLATYSVQFTVQDGCNDSEVHSADFTMEDNTPPIFINPPPHENMHCTDVSFISNVELDDCDPNPTLSFVNNTMWTPGENYNIERTYTATDQCSNTSTYLQIITVINDNLPVPDINISPNQTTVCGIESWDSRDFNTTTSAESYVWFFDTGGNPEWSSDMSVDDVYWNSPGTKTVQMTIWEGGYCLNQNTVDINVVELVPNITSGPSISICDEESVTFSSQTYGGDSPYTYDWYHSSTLTDVGDQPEISFVPELSGSYSLMVFDANGCAEIESLTLTINPIPIAQFITSSTDECIEVDAHFTWDYQSGITYTLTSPGAIYTPDGNGAGYLKWSSEGTKTVTLNALDSNTGCSEIATTQITIHDNPFLDPSFALGYPDETCVNQDEDFTSNIDPSGWNYHWSFGSIGDPVSHNSNNPNISDVSFTASALNHSVLFLANDFPCIYSETITIDIYEVTADYTSVPPANGCAGFTEEWTAVPAGGSGTYTYEWYAPGGTTPFSTTQTVLIDPTVIGDYKLIVFDDTVCSDEIIITKVNCINDPNDPSSAYTDSRYNLYPNPTDSNIFFSYQSSKSKPVKLEMYSSSGQLVFTNEFDMKEGDNTHEIQTQDFAAGLYLVKISDGTNVYSDKISIIRK